MPSIQPPSAHLKVLESVSAGSETSSVSKRPVVRNFSSQRAASAPAVAMVASPRKRKLSDGHAPASGSKEKKAKVDEVAPEKAPVAKEHAGKAAPEDQQAGLKRKAPQQTPPPIKKRRVSEPPQSSKPSGPACSATPNAKISDTPSSSKTLRVWPSGTGSSQVKGLWNPHSYCYRRSALQSLLCTPHFTNLLALHPHCNKPCVVCAMSQLSNATHTSTGPSTLRKPVQNLDAIIKTVSKDRRANPKWSSHTQQDDAFLFLAYLLETLEHAQGIPKSAFNAVYTIKHRTSWKCSNCGKQHVSDLANPPSTSLQVPLAGRSLANCLDAHHRETGTTITCDKTEGGCGHKAERTRLMTIRSAPEILTVQIKRFGFASRRGRKNSAFVDVPETLDLAKWACEGSKEGMKYRLQAVVLHGGELGGGHYIAYVKTPGGGGGGGGKAGAGGWLHVSDESVSRGGTKTLHEKDTYCPYILTYVKVDG